MHKLITTILIISFLLVCLSGHAKNLGVWGATFPVAEQDIKEFIFSRLRTMQQNGELDKINASFIRNVKTHTLRPKPVEGITTTDRPQTFYYDPTYILQKTITDDRGNVIARAGTTINPLNTITLHGVLFFLDADDKKQINWAIEHTKKYDYVRHILVRGNIKEAGDALGERIYFDQAGLITKQLGIKHVPCIVRQSDTKLQIQEFAVSQASYNRVKT